MHMLPLLFAVLLITRANSTYHPHLLFKRYVIIKNKAIVKLLIGQSDPANCRSNNRKANRNKLTYSGIIFYVLFLVLCCFSITINLLPEIPCESFVFESRTMFLTADTLNEKLPFIFALTLLFTEAAFNFINTSKYAAEKASPKRLTQTIYYFFSALFSVSAVGTLWIAIASILKAI